MDRKHTSQPSAVCELLDALDIVVPAVLHDMSHLMCSFPLVGVDTNANSKDAAAEHRYYFSEQLIVPADKKQQGRYKGVQDMLDQNLKRYSSPAVFWRVETTGKCGYNALLAVLLDRWKMKLVHKGVAVTAVAVVSGVPVRNLVKNEADRVFVYLPKHVPFPTKEPLRAEWCDRLLKDKHQVAAVHLANGERLMIDVSCAQYGCHRFDVPAVKALGMPVLVQPWKDVPYGSNANTDDAKAATVDEESAFIWRAILMDTDGSSSGSSGMRKTEDNMRTGLQWLEKQLAKYLSPVSQIVVAL
jgi:hypothetical protein